MPKGNTLVWVGVGVAFLVIWSNSANGNPTGDPTAANATDVSSGQLLQTQNFENLQLMPYPDGTDSNGNQLYSIGYGHQIQPGESYLMAGISNAQASQLLSSDGGSVSNYINGTGNNFTQGQFDALWDFGFNEGISSALPSVISTYNNNGASAVPALMAKYIYWHPVPGGAAQINQNLVSRRNANIATWNSGTV